MIVVSCAIGAYAIQNAMFDIRLMLWVRRGRLCLQEDQHFAGAVHAGAGARQSRRGRVPPVDDRIGRDMKVFWSNGLVGSITTLAIVLLFWPLIGKAFGSVGRLWRPAKASG
jgi:putative tricarboxylic transport membrane protein